MLALTNTQAAASASEAVQSLRLWRRQHNRALELGLQLPDPLILVKALDGIMQTLLSRNSQATFRVNAFRMQQQVDVRPTSATLGHLYDLLLSEADQMLYGQPPEADMLASRDSVGSVKAMQASPTPNNKPIPLPVHVAFGEPIPDVGWPLPAGLCMIGLECLTFRNGAGSVQATSTLVLTVPIAKLV